MNEKYCQSCGMPMGDNADLYGTNADGSKNEDYCKYCYENGEFTSDCTMEEMIEICVGPMVEVNSNISKEEATKMMLEFFPTLKRWQTA